MSSSLTSALDALPRLRALVVGGTAGIGLGVAQQLCNHRDPATRITIAGRNAAAAAEICAEFPAINFKRIDASSMKQTKIFCTEFAKDLATEGSSTLNLLVLCQGIISAKVEPTAEGIDVALALNYYSRMLIIRELTSLNALASDAIIVSVLNARFGDTLGDSILWDDMDLSRGLYGFLSIRKILKHNLSMQDIMLQQLSVGSKRTFVHNYPGFVTTKILDNAHFPFPVTPVKWVLRILEMRSTKYVTPAFAGEKIIVGAVDAWRKQGQSWFCTDDSGKEIEKPMSPDDVRRRVAEHTWSVVDRASASM